MTQIQVIVPVPASYEGPPPSFEDIQRSHDSCALPQSVPTIKRVTDARITDAEGKTMFWLGDQDLHVFRYTWEV